MNRLNRPAFLTLVHLAFGLAAAMFASGCAGPVDGGAAAVPGSPAASGAATATAAGAQSVPASSTVQRLRGMYTHMVDTGSFIDCRSGQRLVVATEGDNAALERAYLKARAAPGIPVLATVDGHVESRVFMEGPERPMLIVERFVEVRADHNCNGPVAPVSLENTYWKLLSLQGSPAIVFDGQTEPHLILRSPGGQIGGSGGCNRLLGSYSVDGDRLSLSGLAATMMACPQGMQQERTMLDMLGEVGRWRIFGDHLQLLGGSGEMPLAQFEARALR